MSAEIMSVIPGQRSHSYSLIRIFYTFYSLYSVTGTPNLHRESPYSLVVMCSYNTYHKYFSTFDQCCCQSMFLLLFQLQ